MCMPLFQRLRAQSLKHLAAPLYVRHYVHARGETAKRRPSSEIYDGIVVSITLESRVYAVFSVQFT